MIRTLRRRASRMVIGILALIGVIFIAESFTTQLSNVLTHGGSAMRLAALLGLKLPEIVDFALPLALMLGIYFALTGARDDNELMICAAAGISWTAIPRFAFAVGLLGFLISLGFSAVVTPTSAYLMRLAVYQMEVDGIARKIEGGGPTSFLRTVENRTVIATPSPNEDAQRGNLFVYQELGVGGGWRFDQADDWTVVQGDLETGFRVELQGYRTYSGLPEGGAAQGILPSPSGPSWSIGTANIQVSNLVLDISDDSVLPVLNRARQSNEALFLGLFDTVDWARDLANPSPRFAEALSRALLCLFAALVAVAGAAWSGTRFGKFTALPVTLGLVLAFDIFSRAALADAARVSGALFWQGTGLATVLAIGAPLAAILLRREAIILPQSGRA